MGSVCSRYSSSSVLRSTLLPLVTKALKVKRFNRGSNRERGAVPRTPRVPEIDSCCSLLVLGLSSVPLWLALLISFALGVAVALVIQFVVRPKLVEWVKKGSDTSNERSKDAPMNLNVITVGTLSQLNFQGDKQVPDGMMESLGQPKFHPSKDI